MADTVAIVTGAAGGIGRELCRAFLAAGDDVIGVDLRFDAAVEGAEILALDLRELARDGPYADRALASLEEAIGSRRTRVLVNNAAVQLLGPLERERWRATFDVNLLAPVVLIEHLETRLAAATGSVVNIASVHATQSKPGFAAYATSKAALAAMTRNLALELAPAVRLNAISPAAVDTGMLRGGLTPESLRKLEAFHPLRRIAQPSEIAAAAVWLASCSAGFVTGAVLDVDGGIAGRLYDPE